MHVFVIFCCKKKLPPKFIGLKQQTNTYLTEFLRYSFSSGFLIKFQSRHSRAAVIWRLNRGWRICFQDSSLHGCWQDSEVSHYISVRPWNVLTWQLTSPEQIIQENASKWGKSHSAFCNLKFQILKSYPIPIYLFSFLRSESKSPAHIQGEEN